MSSRAPWRHESFARAWLRRCLTIPAYLILGVLLLVLAPVLLVLAIVTDLLSRRSLALARTVILAEVYFLAELVGMLASLILWVRHKGWRTDPSPDYLTANFVLQYRWAGAIFEGARRAFGLRMRLEGEDELRPGPVIVLGRHASPLDNLIPAVIVSGRQQLRLRWVMNRWLLRDPCLDIVGNRLPNVFVATSTDEPRGQAARVGALAGAMGTNDGLLIFPEGALFSPARLGRAVDRLIRAEAEDAELASGLRSVLPPRSGAFLSALAAAPDADVVFCEHRGLDAARDYRALLSGGLTGAEVVIRIRRIPRRDIPDEPAAQTAWLWTQWVEVDRWVREGTAQTRSDEGRSKDE